ncbi:MAG: hypothetical protein LBV45_08420 [Xanthomonadaceae bacterium]|nr:hypothetical protein [Xanthomonadaceae bacterium]
MADYQCYPLWEASPGVVGNINPGDLPISSDIKNRLLAWANLFDATLDIDNPIASGFKSEQAFDEFKKEGEALVHELQKELGPNYLVTKKI